MGAFRWPKQWRMSQSDFGNLQPGDGCQLPWWTALSLYEMEKWTQRKAAMALPEGSSNWVNAYKLDGFPQISGEVFIFRHLCFLVLLRLNNLNLPIFMLSEYFFLLFKWFYLQSRNRLTGMENRFVVAKGEGGGSGTYGEFGISRCKLLQISNEVLLYSTGNHAWSPGTDHDAREYEKKNVYIYIYHVCNNLYTWHIYVTVSLCRTEEFGTTL